ncbi:MAG: UPF0182 family protein [Chlorogloea purpurea SAG 13.99]|nr:UPF0182 family protein [Chlorogloea purpurea SAG 13.99]
MSNYLQTSLSKSVGFLLMVILVGGLLVQLVGEILWFQEVHYLDTFLKRLGSQLGLGLLGTLLSIGWVWFNIRLSEALKWPHKVDDSFVGVVKPQSVTLDLTRLLITLLGLTTWLGLLLIYYSQVSINLWTPIFNLPNLNSPLQLNSFGAVLPQLWSSFGPLILITSLTLFLFISPHLTLRLIALFFSAVSGLILAGNWSNIFKYFAAVPFNKIDPQFQLDLSFYIFKLPLWQLAQFWLTGLISFSLITVSFIYLLSGNSLSEGKFIGFSRLQLRHLYGLWGLLMLLVAFHHVIGRYNLLYSPIGVVFGAGYTDSHVQQFVDIALGLIAAISGIWLLGKAITGASRSQIVSRKKAKATFSRFLLILGFYILVFIIGLIATNTVQKLIVQPNELLQEKPYIERSIKSTRAAFALDKIDARIFDPKAQLTKEVLQRNHLTIDNIRLWDTKPLLQTNRQLQQIRSYYKFPDADIDRYNVKVKLADQPQQPSEKQQVIISARELDYSAVPPSAQTWVNQHLVYTHGYGFTLSPVNLVDEGGLPYYFVKDIGTYQDQAALRTSSESIQSSIPIGKPRIYFGQLTNNHIMTSTKVKEFDFPSGEDNVYNTYDGTGGINIGSIAWERWLFALYLKDWQMLFTRDFTPETRLLFRRDIESRIGTIAPFLNFERNPYLVAADVGDSNSKLHWIIDGYTTSAYYPYSDPGKDGFNYIRNSVKVVVDAYNGDVDFYISDADDPIIKTWAKIFPHLFKPLSAMPENLKRHIRYPEDFFSTQSERLLIYHMTDPQVFYNREDQWEIPEEIYGTDRQAVQPYYLIMKLPSAEKEEFILMQPYTPTGRPNLIAWLAARSDEAEYGNLLLYQFPKQRLVFGTNQIEALINQTPEISQQISLWNREGSKVLQGHLLVIPIEQSLLYVEPLYLVATKNSLPTIARVTVAYENKIVMEESLSSALEKLFR